MNELEVYSNRVLEPLSKATETLLKPLDLMPNDYLLVGIDKEAKRFVVKIAAMKKSSNGEDRQILCPDGQMRIVDKWNPSYAARRQFINRIPEKKEIIHKLHGSTNKWILAATDFTVLVIHHAWPKDKIIFGEEAKVLYNYILMQFMAQSVSSNLVARFKVEGHVPDMPEDFMDHPDPDRKLSPYQKVALLASLNQPGYALFMEQGTGKTPIVVARINLEGYRKRRKENQMYKALVICPKQVRTNWSKEFERFSVRPGKVSILRGGQVKRMMCLNDGIMEDPTCNWGACIVSIDSVPHMWDPIKIVNWDLIVYDESHKSKNPNTRRFKHFRKYAQFSHIKQRTNLTGTPIANTIMDLWAQWEMLGEGLSGFMSYKNYKSYHSKYKEIDLAEGGSIDKLIGLKNVPLVQERLARISFLLTSEEANIQLPNKVYDYAEVDMTVKQAKIYKRIVTQLVHEIEDSLGSRRMSTDHILTKLLRLAQITSGHLTWDKQVDMNTLKITGGHTEQIDKVNPKVNYIIDEIMDPDRDPNGKMLIWACFIEDLRILSQRLAEAGINHVGYHRMIQDKYRVRDAEAAEHAINFDNSCRVILANPASAGEGLNLIGYDRDHPEDSKMYVDREIFVSCNWSYIIRSQGEKRGHRRDARSPSVRITDLVVPDTIDEEIRERLRYKKDMAMEIQDIRQILRKLVA